MSFRIHSTLSSILIATKAPKDSWSKTQTQNKLERLIRQKDVAHNYTTLSLGVTQTGETGQKSSSTDDKPVRDSKFRRAEINVHAFRTKQQSSYHQDQRSNYRRLFVEVHRGMSQPHSTMVARLQPSHSTQQSPCRAYHCIVGIRCNLPPPISTYFGRHSRNKIVSVSSP
jgi:hypothetical protein